MTDNDIVRRIEALEERVTYQDDAIETLNQTITKQWAQIDALTRQIANLTDRLRETEAKSALGAPGDEPPPHY
ncbi:MAG: SlyX family protein [Pseudomonadota bacterium]